MIYADTSFIASAYGLDTNTASARHFIEANKPRLPLFFLHWPELAKSFWTSHPESAETLWDWVKEDMAGGKKLYPLEIGSRSRRPARREIDHQLLPTLEKAPFVGCHARGRRRDRQFQNLCFVRHAQFSTRSGGHTKTQSVAAPHRRGKPVLEIIRPAPTRRHPHGKFQLPGEEKLG